jgi:hypothetical protein
MATKKEIRNVNIIVNGKEVRNNIKTIAGEYKKAKNELAKLTIGSDEYNKKLKEVKKLKGVLNDHNKQLGFMQKSWQRVTGAIRLALGAFVGAKVFSVLKNALRTMSTFEKEMDKVKAVTGATKDEFDQLKKSAQNLGSTTSKTSTEVAGLQLEFAKLGFSTDEILDATEATIQLSIAAGSDLAQSAKVAASTIKGFGLTADETQRIVDVMAKSFSSSALDLEKFETAMAAVAPVANASGKSVEFTTAQLSVLTDAGIDASTAGTSLRNMFLELNKQGLTWEEGLEAINNSTNKNVTALDLFGKRGATAALVLADNTEKAEKLEESYNNANGSAKEMAETMEDNLIGDTNKLSSAWEGFVLSLNSGEGVITNVFRGLVQWLTNVVNRLQMVNKSLKQIKKEAKERARDENLQFNIDEDKKEVEALAKKLTDVYKDESKAWERAIDLVSESLGKLKGKNEDFNETIDERIKALQELKDTNEEITNDELDTLIFLTDEEKEQKEKEKKQREKAKEEAIKTEQKLADTIAKIRQQLHLDTLTEQAKEIQQVKYKYDKLIEEAEGYDDKIAELYRLRGQEVLTINANYAEKEKEKRTEVEQKIEKMLLSGKEKEKQLIKEKYEELLELAKKYNFKSAELFDKMNEELAKIDEDYATEGGSNNLLAKALGLDDEGWEKLEERFGEIVLYARQAMNAWDAYNQLKRNQDEAEMQRFEKNMDAKKTRLEKQLERGIISQEEYAQKSEQIDQQLDREKAKLMKEQSEREKDAAYFNAIVSTAAAIIGFMEDPGGWPGVALSALAAVTGALQIAAISAETVPTYEQGGRIKKEGLIYAGEGDKEEGILSNRMLTDPNYGPMANYLLDVQDGKRPVMPTTATEMPDAGAVSTAMDYNNFKRTGGQFSQPVVNNTYVTNTSAEDSNTMRELLDEQRRMNQFLSDPKNRQAYINYDKQKESDEEMELLNRYNKF